MARRSKYTEELVQQIEENLKTGKGRVMTCNNVGIHYSTFLDWFDNKSEFSERIKKAEHQGSHIIKETCESVIMKAATANDKPVWQAAAWMLERKFSDEYRMKGEFEHKGKIAHSIDEINFEGLSDEAKKVIFEIGNKQLDK